MISTSSLSRDHNESAASTVASTGFTLGRLATDVHVGSMHTGVRVGRPETSPIDSLAFVIPRSGLRSPECSFWLPREPLRHPPRDGVPSAPSTAPARSKSIHKLGRTHRTPPVFFIYRLYLIQLAWSLLATGRGEGHGRGG